RPALHPAPPRCLFGRRAGDGPIRNTAGAAKPDRLGPGAGRLPPPLGGPACVRPDARVLAAEFLRALPDRDLPQFLDAHARAFEHFGGHTWETLYDRPRTVCAPAGERRVAWNPTFKAFADYWGFEPRLCQPYRAQTKGKVESGVKYFKRNFLPGRQFVDDVHLDEQLGEWMTTIADVRIHGTTHERPIDRFAREQAALVPTGSQPSFRLEAPLQRIVAEDYPVSIDTNRSSVRFALNGKVVEVHRRAGVLRVLHQGALVVEHPELPGRHQLRILPEHGPGAIMRLARQRRSTVPPRRPLMLDAAVEV